MSCQDYDNLMAIVKDIEKEYKQLSKFLMQRRPYIKRLSEACFEPNSREGLEARGLVLKMGYEIDKADSLAERFNEFRQDANNRRYSNGKH